MAAATRLTMLLVSRRAMMACLLVVSVVAIIYWGTLDNLQHVRLASYRTTRRAVLQTWTWRCERRQCVRAERATQPRARMSLATCNMRCGVMPLWPRPTGTTRLGTTYSRFLVERLRLAQPEAATADVRQLLVSAGDLFLANVRRLLADDAAGDANDLLDDFLVSLQVTGGESELNTRLTLATNESYRLAVIRVGAAVRATVRARTFFGARHGLETLLQMMWADEDDEAGVLRVLDSTFVVDEPRFPHRGLLVDTGRNFVPVDALQRTVDAMSASKLNTLHWHLTDSQSFPFDAPRRPEMARHGAYSAEETYSAHDVAGLVEYARLRGVRVLAEVDVPAHAGFGWQWGPAAGLGSLSVCVGGREWKENCGEPPCGQLNPTNNNTYRVLRDIYTDLVELTQPTDMFHMGGDEVDFNCWANSPEVSHLNGVVSMEGMLEMWGVFQARALAELTAVFGGRGPRYAVVWSSDLTKPEVVAQYLPRTSYIVQVWGGSSWGEVESLLTAGYHVIVSHVDAWYLDCGYGSWRGSGPGSCGPYASWQTVYTHRPWGTLRRADRRLLLGGEACLWGEQADGASLDELLWPRAAALAERLWTDPPDLGADDNLREAHSRLSQHRERLVGRGVRAAALWPRWCHHNPHLCLEPKIDPVRQW